MTGRMRTTRSIVNLRQGRNDWYRIRNQAGGAAEVMIYDEIGYFGVTAQDFIRDLADVTGPITLRLNTPGGEVFDGMAIYNALRQRPSVSVYIDGLAASIGSVIAMAASPGQLTIAKHASLMIHDGFSQAIGNAADMRKLADLLDEQSDAIAGIYAERTGQPAEHWRDLMRDESWYIGQAAVDAGLADRVSDSEGGGPLATFDLSIFAGVVLDSDGNHGSMKGTHTHNHPSYGASGGDATHSHPHAHDDDASHGHDHGQAIPGAKNPAAQDMSKGWYWNADGSQRWDPDGDGDDDSCASGDTDHDYWDADGNQLKDVPGKPMKKPFPGAAEPFKKGHDQVSQYFNADKYKQADRDQMAKSGEAMPDGSYPIADAEDLGNAIHAVGRGNADHDDIRAHIIKRAKALGLSSQIPDNWNSDGSLQSTSDLASGQLLAQLFTSALEGSAR